MRVVFVGSVWPEPRSSAAGFRTRSLVEIFLHSEAFSTPRQIYFISPNKPNEHTRELQQLGVHTMQCSMERPMFRLFLTHVRPDVIIFDRFTTEEQFGWMAKEISPETIRILDTQDLHFLRQSREAYVTAHPNVIDMNSVLQHDTDVEDNVLKREIASILRCDHTLFVSNVEREMLKEKFSIPEDISSLAPFFYDMESPLRQLYLSRSFEKRNHFMMIGNFLHNPNVDGIHWMAKEVWPQIRERLPNAQLHIYGAYPDHITKRRHDPSSGFHVKGPIDDHLGLLSKYKINLAPLRFGAGIKGKITDGWYSGTPCVTTPIGSEGMAREDGSFSKWGGMIASNADEFIENSVRLYEDENLWKESQTFGSEILADRFDKTKNSRLFEQRIVSLIAGIAAIRARNVLGSILWSSNHQYTKFFSKFVEVKNLLKMKN